jgi:pre-mRNA-splicing factor CWC26
MSSGKKAGLQTAEVLRQENAEARAREEKLFRGMNPGESGRGAETVYRDKEGRKINPKLERLQKMQEEKKKLEEEEKFMQWGKGVATLRMAEEKIQEELYEMSKPLARYADDEDLERMLKARERDGNPILKFIKKKPKLTPIGKPKKCVVDDLGWAWTGLASHK